MVLFDKLFQRNFMQLQKPLASLVYKGFTTPTKVHQRLSPAKGELRTITKGSRAN